MNTRRRALLVLPALAACYAYAPPSRAVAGPDDGRLHARPHADPYDGADADGDDATDVELRVARGRRRGGDPEEARLRIVEKGQRYLGRAFSGDCSTFVRRVLREADVELGPLPSAGSMSESIHLVARDVREPRAGDLVFFHDTYDRNRDGRLGDRWTHVALVEAVDGDQVSILHRGGKGIIRLRMNLARPHDEAENDPVRAKRRDDPPGTRYLTAELFAGYGAVVEPARR